MEESDTPPAAPQSTVEEAWHPATADARYEAELRRGVVQLVALQLLEVPAYGYKLVRRLAELGFPVEEGTLYPLLRRFEKQGLLSATWNTEGSRPRKYYVLTDDGKQRLSAMMHAWQRVSRATHQALDAHGDVHEEIA